MAERKVIHKGNIGNALHSVAPDHITTTADEIFDEERQEYQQDINEGVGRFIDNPEFIRVEVDSNKRIIRAIKADGTEYLGAGIEVHGNINTDGAVTTVLDNPEFSKVYLDNDGKILYGVQRDGNFYFGSGVPKQIIDYIETRIANLSLDEYEAIVSFLDGLELDENFKTLRELLNEKVDKEEGKSLIDKDFADGVEYIENPEFVSVKLDSNNHILEAKTKDGKKFLGAGLQVVGDVNLDSADITTISNPEFLAIWTVGDKILFAVTTTADFYFGAGVPTQIVKYVDKKISEILGDEDVTIIIDTLKEITSFLDGFISGSNLLEYLNSTYGYYEENPEYVKVYLDSTGKIIRATTIDGIEIFGVGYSIDSIVTTVIDNPEFFKVYVDSLNHIVFGIKKDGDVIFACGVPEQIQKYIESVIAHIVEAIEEIKEIAGIYEDNPEYIEVKTDDNKKILSGRNTDGSAFERVGFSTPKLEVNKIDVTNSADAISRQSTMDDVEERTQVITDEDNKVVSYRDSDGILHEEVGIKTNNLILTEQGMTDFQRALKDSGFNPGGAGDWSDYISEDGDKPLNLPNPRCAILNIISDLNLTTLNKKGWPEAQEGINYNVPCQIEFFDKNGNYFKKWASMSAQGNSSMSFIKKNIAFDFFDSEFDGDAFSVKFEGWVAQDSFHLKAFYTDFFKGVSIMAYNLAEQVDEARGIINKPWQKALLSDYSFGSDSASCPQIDDLTLQLKNDAKCIPQSFPVAVYQNGEFFGVYAWCIKKHRDNYHLIKDNADNIHLDGQITGNTLFNANGNSSLINWNPGPNSAHGFEVRNPKSDYFVTSDGKEYDADVWERQELAGISILGETVAAYASEKSYAQYEKCTLNNRMYLARKAGVLPTPSEASYGKKPKDVWKKATKNWIEITFTNKVKENILTLSTYVTNINNAATDEAKKELIETYFDVDNLIDYELVQMATGDTDGFAKNWQWVTYDGVKWFVCNYDKDMVFGGMFTGAFTNPLPAEGGFMGYSNSTPMGSVIDLYKPELKARWLDLVSKGIFTDSNIISIANDWLDRIGTDYFTKEYEKWPDSNCNRDACVSDKWESDNVLTNEDNYNSSTTYNIGDKCSYKGYRFTAKEQVTDVPPLTNVYGPTVYDVLGYRDNIYRLYSYISQRLTLENTFINSLNV